MKFSLSSIIIGHIACIEKYAIHIFLDVFSSQLNLALRHILHIERPPLNVLENYLYIYFFLENGINYLFYVLFYPPSLVSIYKKTSKIQTSTSYNFFFFNLLFFILHCSLFLCFWLIDSLLFLLLVISRSWKTRNQNIATFKPLSR